MPAPPDPPPPPAKRPPLPRPPKRDWAAEEDAARRLQNIQFQIRRGQAVDAETALKVLLAERPQDAGASELMGDVQAGRGEWDAAQESYKAALTREPGRASAEAKLGRLALRRAEQQRQKTMGVTYAAQDAAMMRGSGDTRSAWPAIVGSALCPGLGQVAQGQYVKGAILAGILLIGLGLFTQLPHDSAGRSLFGPGFWLVLLLLAADWIYAVADAVLFSKSRPSSPSNIDDGWQV